MKSRILVQFLVVSLCLNSFAVGSKGLTVPKFPQTYLDQVSGIEREFAEFRFYKKGEYSISKANSLLPTHEPFSFFTKFYQTLHSSPDSIAMRNWFDVWNSDIQMGVDSFRKVPELDLVAYWKTTDAWTVLFSIGGRRDQSLIPMFISLSEPPVFITDATDLGDFVGSIGKFLKLNPTGVIESVEIETDLIKDDPSGKAKPESLKKTAIMWLVPFLLLTLIVTVFALIRKHGRK